MVVHGKGTGLKDQIRDALKTTYRRQHKSKDHDHGSHQEEEEGEEGSEEVISLFLQNSRAAG
jgi:hypothetical protein